MAIPLCAHTDTGANPDMAANAHASPVVRESLRCVMLEFLSLRSMA